MKTHAERRNDLDRVAPLSFQLTLSRLCPFCARESLADVPLFPGPKDATLPIARDVAAHRLVKAEKLAEVSKLSGGIFHPYRRHWASERKHLSSIDVANAGGWKSTKTLAIYRQSDPIAVLAAVVNGG